MATKKQIQETLKQRHGINKNISQEMSPQACEDLLRLMEREPSISELVDSFSEKNTDLSNNNRRYGQLRSQAERQLEKTKAECEQLQQSVVEAQSRLESLRQQRGGLSKEQEALEQEIMALQKRNTALGSDVQALKSKTKELTTANTALKKDNKALKNIVDQIRLKLALDIRQLMRYEDSELRKAAARLFKWTQE